MGSLFHMISLLYIVCRRRPVKTGGQVGNQVGKCDRFQEKQSKKKGGWGHAPQRSDTNDDPRNHSQFIEGRGPEIF